MQFEAEIVLINLLLLKKSEISLFKGYEHLEFKCGNKRKIVRPFGERRGLNVVSNVKVNRVKNVANQLLDILVNWDFSPKFVLNRGNYFLVNSYFDRNIKCCSLYFFNEFLKAF